MLLKLFAYFKTATIRQTTITFSSTFINGLLGLAFYILVARFLGPEAFGLFNVTIVLITMVSDIADLGTNTGIVSFVGRYFIKSKALAYKYLKLGLIVKITLGVLVIILGEILSGFIALDLFQKKEILILLRVGFVGALGYLIFGFATSCLQATQKFFRWALLYIGTNLIRLLLIITFFLLGILTKELTTFVYFLVLFLGFLFFLLIFPTNFLYYKTEPKIVKNFLHFNKWVAAFIVVSALSSRIDSFISVRLLAPLDLGFYSAANQLVQVVPQFVSALGIVIAPKMASMGKRESFISYFKKTQLLVTAFCIIGALATPVMAFLIPLVLGDVYLGSQIIFVILMIAMLIFLFSVPIHSAVIYYFSYPRLFFWLSLIHLFTVLTLGVILIRFFGAVGASLAVLVGSMLNFVVPCGWLVRKLR